MAVEALSDALSSDLFDMRGAHILAIVTTTVYALERGAE